MNYSTQSASDIFGQFSGKVIKLKLNNGSEWVGIMAAAGGVQRAGSEPEPAVIHFDRITDMEQYSKLSTSYKMEAKTVSPGDIKAIEILDEPVWKNLKK